MFAFFDCLTIEEIDVQFLEILVHSVGSLSLKRQQDTPLNSLLSREDSHGNLARGAWSQSSLVGRCVHSLSQSSSVLSHQDTTLVGHIIQKR